jgi:hypothetical protein
VRTERVDHPTAVAGLLALQARLRKEPATWQPAHLTVQRAAGSHDEPWPAPGELPALQRRNRRRPAPGELPALQRHIVERLAHV